MMRWVSEVKGMDMAKAERKAEKGHSRLRNRMAPSRHSGDSSLSPNDPNSSETMMSAGSGTSIVRMSPKMISTDWPHSSAWRSC